MQYEYLHGLRFILKQLYQPFSNKLLTVWGFLAAMSFASSADAAEWNQRVELMHRMRRELHAAGVPKREKSAWTKVQVSSLMTALLQ